MIDQAAPDITLPATGDQSIRLADLHGKTVVLYCKTLIICKFFCCCNCSGISINCY